MARLDPYEAAVIRQCNTGDVHAGGKTGSVCRKRSLCTAEGRCHFVASAERHIERAAQTVLRTHNITWSRGFDPEPKWVI